MIPGVNKDYEQVGEKIKEEVGFGVSGIQLNTEKQEARVSDSEVQDEEDASFVLFKMRNDKFAPEDQTLNPSNSSNNDNDNDDGGGDGEGDDVEGEEDGEGNGEMGISSGNAMVVSGGDTYKSLLSEFDDFVANEKNGAMVGTSRALSYGFEVGDMVWGKVKSHPWWPGHIFNEAFASSSVRRTRREGHVLVAFFGDSSYGWFDPAELIPFDIHFAEKSQQTNQKNFVKAVEEAVDEASRRCGLGLTCKCRNPYNFRPANVGYFTVDVPDFEGGGVYSVNQIKKARDEFRPVETLEYLKQLALRPQEYECNTMDYIKNRATILAFRKAVFEEFDETYAQAFGAHSSRSAIDRKKSDESVKEPPNRAPPLSGPLVIAETLGGGRSSKKIIKGKHNPKKDRFLLKRREEPSDSRILQIVPKQSNSSAPAVYVDGSSGIGDGDYVLQKRAPVPLISGKHEQAGLIVKEDADPSDVTGEELGTSVHTPGSHGVLAPDSNPKLSPKKEKGALQETGGKQGLDVVVDPANTSRPDIPGKAMLQGAADGTQQPILPEGDSLVNHRPEGTAELSRSKEGPLQVELSCSARAEGDSELPKLQDGPLGTKHSAGTSADALLKKAKLLKRPLGELSSENTVMGEKRKKKKLLGAETNTDRPLKKRLSTGKGGVVAGNAAGKSTQISSSPREDPRVNYQKKDFPALPMVGVATPELDLQKLLSDLHSLALDPFHSSERNSPSIAIQFLLRFRSLVYQKSLVVTPQSETTEPVEIRGTKSPSIAGKSDNSARESTRDLTSLKPVKSISRPEDPTRAGRKRLPSDRQEEIAAKRLKKITQLKSMAAGKKGAQRGLETQRAEGKEPTTQAPMAPPSKSVKQGFGKKMEPPARAVEPTMLVMKFPPETALPSVAELKARFARFGSIDQSAIRVFWKSLQCRVVFQRKLDAQAAYRYAVGNSSLFGNVNVRYIVREVGAPASEAPESDKGRGDETSIEATRARDPLLERPASALVHQPLLQSTIQLKSILKKPTGDEAGGNGGRVTPRVKFMLGGEESNRGEQLMVGNRNFNNNNASFADGGASTSVAMDISSKNFQKVIPPSPLPLLPIPPQFAKAPLNNSHHTEIAPRNLPNPGNGPSVSSSSTPSMDISQQMLSLLTRCNDVVSSVTGYLGYVPYHPL